jgi:hypothetical protein
MSVIRRMETSLLRSVTVSWRVTVIRRDGKGLIPSMLQLVLSGWFYTCR